MQLAQCEQRVCELQLQLRDARAAADAASALEDKLRIANRNARALEEENAMLHAQLAAAAGGDGDARGAAASDDDSKALSATTTPAVRAIIDENAQLRAQVQQARAALAQAEREVQVAHLERERRLREAASEVAAAARASAQYTRERDEARAHAIELQATLEMERAHVQKARQLWDDERARLQQREAELRDALSSSASGLSPRHGTNSVVAMSPTDMTAKERLLRDECAALERRLRDAAAEHARATASWHATEAQLRSALDAAIAAARQQQQRAAAAASSPPPQATTPHVDLSEGGDDDSGNDEQEVSALRARVLSLQDSVDAADVRVRELTVQLRSAEASIAAIERERDVATSATQQARDEARTLRDEARATREAVQQREAALQHELVRLRAAIATATAERDAAAMTTTPPPRQQLTLPGAEASEAVRQLVGDKNASVEEVMEELEAAWQEVDALRAQLQCAAAAYRELQDERSASSDATTAADVATLRRALAEAEAQVRSGDAVARDVEQRLRDELDAAQRTLHKAQLAREAADDECAALRRRAEAAEDKSATLAQRIDAMAQKQAAEAARRRAASSSSRRRVRGRSSGARSQPRRRSLAQSAASLVNDVATPVASATLRRVPVAASPSIVVTPTAPVAVAAPQPPRRSLSQLSLESSAEQHRSVVPSGAHLAVTIVELSDVARNGVPVSEPGYIVIKVKSIKEKYKTSVKTYAPVTRFDETFIFYLAQPDQDVITLHVFYKTRSGAREYHIGDVCFSMATLYRGVPRRRVAPVMQDAGTRDARRAGQVEVVLQSDDFGRTLLPGVGEVEEEEVRFAQLLAKLQTAAPEKLHAADVYMASAALL